MLSGISTLFSALCVLLSIVEVASAPDHCTSNGEVTETCERNPAIPRSGGALIQRAQKASTQANVRDDPEELYLPMTGRMSTMEARVTSLEENSGKGREELKAGIDALTATVETIKSGGEGSLDDTVSKVTAAQTQQDSLEKSVDESNAELRKDIESLTTEFETLRQSVGERMSAAAMLQTGQEPADDAATAAPEKSPAPPPPAGGALTARCAALEARVEKMETDSHQGRDDLKTQLEALSKDVDTLESGGVGSLEHTASLTTSAEREASSLQGVMEENTADLQTLLERLQGKIDGLTNRVGASAHEAPEGALLQTASALTPTATAGTQSLVSSPTGTSLTGSAASPAKRQDPASSAKLPLNNRMAQLEKRIQQLEDASSSSAEGSNGRGELGNKLNLLTERVGSIKAGGTASLEHTHMRVGSVTEEITNMEGAATQQKETLAAAIAKARADLSNLQAIVGAQ